jgi:signal transduction histidine kinase/Tfp pilus assembly protein PilF
MKSKTFILLVLLISNFSFSQVNTQDSFNLVLRSDISDTLKIDKINVYITKYAANDPAIALLYADSALKMSLQSHDSSRLAHSYSRKGIAYFYLGDYNTSLENYFKAITIKENINKKELSVPEYNNIGLVLRNLEQNEEALKYFHLALDLAIKTGNTLQISTLWNNIGISYRGLKQYEKAEKAISLALDFNTEASDSQKIAHNLNNLGMIRMNLKDYPKAIEYFKQALRLNKSLYNNYEQAQNMNNLASVYLQIGDLPKAKSLLIDLGAMFITLKADMIQLEYIKTHANYYHKTNDFINASKRKDQYITFRDSLNNANRFKQFDQLKMLANSEKEIQKFEFLKQISRMQQEKIRAQTIVLLGGSLLLIVIVVLFSFTLKSLKVKKELNGALIERTNKIETLNEELTLANEELHAQRDHLESVLKNLQNTQDQLIQSEKLASIGILAAGVAHEINNPLNFIQGGVLGIDHYVNDKLPEHLPELSPLLNGIQEGVNRAAGIVSSLNQYSRQDVLMAQNCNVHEILDNCLDFLQNHTKDRIVVTKNYTTDKHLLSANEGKLHQAFLNILTNAVQAIEAAGKLRISTQIENHHLKVLIEDSGTGISPENLTKLFTPFFTTKPPGQGTGLGLAITFNVISEHNGKISIESDLGKGTKVGVLLPLKSKL